MSHSDNNDVYSYFIHICNIMLILHIPSIWNLMASKLSTLKHVC